jgi:general L-amino acid transport system substrate-binding protein
MRLNRILLIVALLVVTTTGSALFNNYVSVNSNTAVFAQAEPMGKLAEVIERGALNCGVSGTLPGFSAPNPDTGVMEGLDADYCRAVAAAIFGAEDVDGHINFVSLTANERFTALQAGEVDVLMRNTTWTLTRDASLNSDFGPTTFYDGQGLMVKSELIDLGAASLADLEGARFCSQSGTTTEKNMADQYSAVFGELPVLVLGETSDATLADFENDACDVLTSDKSQLAALRSASSDPSSMVMLPDTLSKEPLGPMYLDDDAQFADVVNWATYATFTAEELGITSENVGDMMGSDDVSVARFLGQDDSALGAQMGLSNDFAAHVVMAVGNYAEIYARTVDPIGVPRAGSLNGLWTDGGLLYSPAWR